MSKKILSLCLAFCMVLGLLVPAVKPQAEALAEDYTLKIGGVSYTLSAYDAPVYSKNATKTGYFNTTEKSYVTQEMGGSETDYNAKLVWNTGDNGPTLYLKNLIVDNYDEELALWRSESATSTTAVANAAIYTGNNAPLKIVIEGDSSIQARRGLHYRDDLEIKSVGDAKLDLWTYASGIMPTTAETTNITDNNMISGKKLTLDANLNITLNTWLNSQNGGYIVRAIGADMVINGGNISAKYVSATKKSVTSFGVTTSGNLYVNGGYVYGEAIHSSGNYTNAAFRVTAGNVYISGGTVEAYAKSHSGIRAKNIYITGGTVKTDTNYASMFTDSSDGEISITGGTVEATVRTAGKGSETFSYYSSSKNTQYLKRPVLGAEAEVYAGAAADSATKVSDPAAYGYVKAFIKVTNPAAEPTETTPVETTAPVQTTEAPTETTAPAQTTLAPTETTAPAQTTEAPTETTAPVQTTEAPTESTAAPTETTAPAQTSAPTEATTPVATIYELKIGGVSYGLTGYDTPVYSKNTTKTGYFNLIVDSAVSTSTQKEYIAQAIGGGDADYNVKLVWKTGENGPTLYLKGAIVDNYDEELSLWRYASATATSAVGNAGIYTGDAAPLKIVIEADSSIQTRRGIHYREELEIKSENDAKLDLWVYGSGIVPTNAEAVNINTNATATNLVKGKKLTLDANLNVTLNYWINASNSGYIIRTVEADMIINGGNIVTAYASDTKKDVTSVGVVTSGNLYINGGYVYGVSVNSSANYTSAAFRATAGNVYINGGVVEAYAYRHSGIRAANIYMTGGLVKTDTYFGCLLTNNDTGVISITGGSVMATVRGGSSSETFAYYVSSNQKLNRPVFGEEVQVYAGTSADTATKVSNPATYGFIKAYIEVVYPGAPTDPSVSAPTSSTTPAQTTAPTTTTPTQTTPTALTSYTVKMDNISYTITAYDTPVYSVNGVNSGFFHTVADGAVVSTVTKDYPSQVKTDANESNYNVKLVWHTGDNGPTLYLRNAIIDTYDDELAKWRYKYETAKDIADYAAIVAPVTAPLKIVIEGGESKLHVYEGIHFANDLTIESVGDAKLDLWTYRTGIIPTKTGNGYVNSHVSGAKLTLNANLNISLGTWANASNAGYIVRTKDADLTINGGNIVIDYRGAAKDCRGIGVENSGNMYINGGYLYAESYNSASLSDAAIRVAGDIYISGGTVEAYSKNQGGIRAKNIYITGGTVKTNTNYAGLFVTSETGVISISDAVLVEATVRASSGAFPFAYMYTNTETNKTAQGAKAPTIAAGMYVAAGTSVYTYEIVEKLAEYDFKDKYIRVSKDVPPPTEATEAPPTTAPTQATAPTLTNPTVDATAAAGAAVPKPYTMKIGSISLTVSKYEEAVYTMNKEADGLDMKGNKYTKIVQTSTGANEENWNAKLIWHVGDAAPTLYLRGFVLDEYNNESGLEPASENDLMEATYDAEKNTYTRKTTAAITTSKNWPLNIVLTGADSKIEAHFGITFYHNTTLTSDGDTKLTMNNYGSCISPNKTYGALTIDANLDLLLRKYYNTEQAAAVIHTYGGTLTINGGKMNLKCSTAETKRLVAMHARYNGDLIINGGDINAMSIVGRSRENGCLRAEGMMYINGGKLKVVPKLAIALYAKKGIVMNGGDVTLMATWNAVNTGSSSAPGSFTFNGGNLTIMSQICFDATTRKGVWTLGEGTFAYAGINAKDCEIFDGSKLKLAGQPWMFFTNDPSKQIEVKEEEEEEDFPIFTLPTTAPDAPEAPDATEVTEVTVAPGEDIESYLDPNTKITLSYGEIAKITQEMIDAGYDSAEVIRDALLGSIWALDEDLQLNVNYIAMFDAEMMYKDGEDWVPADETHFPESGVVPILLPYPKGTNAETPFIAVHMFSSSAFGRTPGEIEWLYTESVEEGLLVYVTGLSPIMIGWNMDASGEVPDAVNPGTGDTDIAMFVALMVVALFGMVAVVYAGKKRIV